MGRRWLILGGRWFGLIVLLSVMRVVWNVCSLGFGSVGLGWVNDFVIVLFLVVVTMDLK